MSESMSEPIRVLPLEYSAIVDERRGHPRLWLLAHLAWIICLVATLLIAGVDVESVIVTGPVIAAAGVTLLISAVRVRSTPHIILGATHVAICLLFFVLVQQLQWGPRQATGPFAIMGTIYTAVCAAMTVLLHLRPKLIR